MTKKHELLLALRNGINKLTGKQDLITEYEQATHIITRKLDRMNPGAVKDKLMDEFHKITEETYESDGKGNMNISGFNQYKTSKKNLKQKIELTKKLIQQMKAER